MTPSPHTQWKAGKQQSRAEVVKPQGLQRRGRGEKHANGRHGIFQKGQGVGSAGPWKVRVDELERDVGGMV